MAEQLGDAAERGAAHHQPRREGVPEVVPGEVFDAGELQGGAEAVLDVMHRFARRLAELVREDVRVLRVAVLGAFRACPWPWR